MNIVNVILSVWSFLSRNYGRLPRWAQVSVYFLALAYVFVASLLILQGYFVYEGWVMRERGNNVIEFVGNVQVTDENSDIRVVSDVNGKIILPVSIVPNSLNYTYHGSLDLLVRAPGGSYQRVKGSLGGIFDRRVKITLPYEDRIVGDAKVHD